MHSFACLSASPPIIMLVSLPLRLHVDRQGRPVAAVDAQGRTIPFHTVEQAQLVSTHLQPFRGFAATSSASASASEMSEDAPWQATSRDFVDVRSAGPLLQCAHCGVQQPSMQACPDCRKSFYCNPLCHADHWERVHRRECAQRR
jgi:hypothetical protein